MENNELKVAPTLSEEEFFTQLDVAVSTLGILDLTDHVVCLTKVIRLKRSGSLRIQNGKIIGFASSIFSLGTDRKNGPPALILEGTTLRHCFECQENESPYAAIFTQGRARVELTDTHINSPFGFGLWAKHSSHITMRNCTFDLAGRSAIACFNSARVELTDCSIAAAQVHGICVRGSSQALLTNCQIMNCADNAVVVYQRGSLVLTNCLLSKTQNALMSAIHVEASEPYDAASITLVHCQILKNAGSAIILCGKVSHNIEAVGNGNDIDGVVTLNVDDPTKTSFIQASAHELMSTQASSLSTTATISETEFEARLQLSLKTSTALDLSDHVVIVTKPIQIPKHNYLQIVNGTFIGQCHSIFLLHVAQNNKHAHDTEILSTLSLHGTVLIHEYFTAEKRGIGAAIFVQGKA